ncbi:carbohydrate esterase family 16 protein [Mycena floridula]|nr:carbohydrate esterase family 16 protein [Mycena floridula]
MLPILLTLALASFYPLDATALFLTRDSSKPVHLAVTPKCGPLSGTVADTNSGVKNLSFYNTIVGFGDGYTDSNDTTSNGAVWISDLANATGATLMNYATNGAVIDNDAYAGRSNSTPDFFAQVGNYITDTKGVMKPADKTLYVAFFGIDDFIESNGFTTVNSSDVAGGLIFGLLELTSSPIFAKNILIVDLYGQGNTTEAGEAYRSDVFAGVNALAQKYKVNVAFANLLTIWDGVFGSTPGFEAFGYSSDGACLNGTTTPCADPDHTFYWTPGVPSAATHGLISDYVQDVIATC